MTLFRRFGRPGLLGTVAPPASAPSGIDIATQLTQLAGLRRSGTLTEAEYEAAKARVLAG
jgi:Short C-terminal domain